MTLYLTSAEWERIAAAGSGVLFREGGIATSSLDDKGTWTDIPPYEFVEAAAACETCGGTGSIEGRNIASWDLCYADDCVNGKRRVAVVVPCYCRPIRDAGKSWPYGDCLVPEPCTDGFVTVGHVVVTWGPAIVVLDQEEIGSAYEGPACVEINPITGFARYWPAWSGALEYEDGIDVTLPPDVDPQSLVGQYAIGVEVVS